MGSLNPGYITLPIWAEKIKQLLSGRKTGFVIVLLIIISRVLQQLYFFNTRNDMTYQILGAQYFLDGHGISTVNIAATDISDIIYQPINQWPPGFSILFIPFYLLFGKHYIVAAIALGIVCAIILISVSRAILKILEVPYYLINLYTILSGLFGYYFYTKPCTDAVGITFLTIAIYYALLLIKEKKASFKNIFFLSSALLLSGFIKYLFIPVALAVAVFILLKGWALKSHLLKRVGIITVFILLAVFGSFMLYQKKASGAIGYIKETERGFYPENLKTAFPFITGSFIKPDTAVELLPSQSESNSFLIRSFQVISLLAFAFLLIYSLKSIRKELFKTVETRKDFLYLSVLVSLLIVVTLVFLSLRVAKEPLDFGQTWTYVEEPRYYGLINVLLHIGVFALYPVYKAAKSRSLRILLPALIILMIPEMLRGAVFTTNRILHISKERYGWQYELGFQKKADAIANVITEREKDRKIILTGTSDWMTLRVSLYSHLLVFTDVNKLLNLQQLKTSKPVTLFAVIREDHMEEYKSFISLENVRYEGAANGFFFYSYNLNPQ